MGVDCEATCVCGVVVGGKDRKGRRPGKLKSVE